MSEDPVRAVAERLYGLAPGEFTPARDEEARAAKDGGDRAVEQRVKRLRKPSTAAWVVNLLVRRRPDQIGQLLDVGASLRQAQSDLDADALRELTRQRRRLVAAVAGDGRALARELGVKVSESVSRQVEDTLHAAMIDTDAAAAVRTGMLLDPLAPAGLGSPKAAGAVSEHTAVGLLEAAGTTARAAGTAGRAKGTRPGLAVVPDAGRPGRSGRTGRTGASASGSSGASASGSSGASAGGSAGRAGTRSRAGDRQDRERAEREERARQEAERREAEEREAAERAAEEHRRAIAEADRALAEAEDAADDAQRRRRKAEKRVAKLEARGLQLQAEAEELRRRLAEVEHEAETLDDETGEAEERRDRAVERAEEADARLEEARRLRAELD